MRVRNSVRSSHLLWVLALSLMVFFCVPMGVAASDEAARVYVWDSVKIKPQIQEKLDRLRQVIKYRKHSFEVGYSPVLEKPIEQLCGLVEPPDWQDHAPVVQFNELYSEGLPTSYDWRQLGGVSPVKNQGSCGSCWAFGTVAVLESQIMMHCKETKDLSEQYLISCNQNNWGCNGGWWAHGYHQNLIPPTEKEPGAVLESAAPYAAKNSSCGGPYEHPYRLSSWAYISGYGVPSVKAIKQAIYDYGPVAAAVCVGSGFQGYRSGIFSLDEKGACNGGVNHAIVLVGWHDDLGPDNGYWILKNSWGTYWGQSGYMFIRYGVSNVGYAANYINFADCGKDTTPSQNYLNCADAVPLSLGSTHNGNTAAGTSTASSYKGTSRTLSGPEVVHKITTTQTGDLKASLSNLSGDLDVLILGSCDPQSTLAYGDATATYASAPPGTYYVVVDGNNGAAGSYSLNVSTAARLPDLTGAWTLFTSSSGGKRVSARFAVQNTGSVNASSFRVAFYLSDDGQTPGKLLTTALLRSGLKANQSVTVSFSYSSRTSIAGKQIIAVVDSAKQVVESDENNNAVASPKVTASYSRVRLNQLLAR